MFIINSEELNLSSCSQAIWQLQLMKSVCCFLCGNMFGIQSTWAQTTCLPSRHWTGFSGVDRFLGQTLLPTLMLAGCLQTKPRGNWVPPTPTGRSPWYGGVRAAYDIQVRKQGWFLCSPPVSGWSTGWPPIVPGSKPSVHRKGPGATRGVSWQQHKLFCSLCFQGPRPRVKTPVVNSHFILSAHSGEPSRKAVPAAGQQMSTGCSVEPQQGGLRQWKRPLFPGLWIS